MPDRIIGSDFTLRADLGSSAGPVTVTVFDPLDTEVVEDEEATFISGGWWEVTIDPGSNPVEGVWFANWEYPGGIHTDEFTVGRRGYLPKHQMRVQIAQRVDYVHIGEVSFHVDAKVTDQTLHGGTNDFRGWWFVPDGESNVAGRFRRVKNYNGSALDLSLAYSDVIPPGTRYHLLRSLSPLEIDAALEETFSGLRRRDRPDLHVQGLELQEFASTTSKGWVLVPGGWDYLRSVWIEKDGHTTQEVNRDKWRLLPGRMVEIDGCAEDATISLYGARDSRSPLWEDSRSDISPELIVPATVHKLHASRARGATTDPDEHIRRTVMAYQQFEDSLRRFSKRIPNNLREVLW